MAKAKKLPSGSWSCQVYSHTEIINGTEKRKYQRFTAQTKKEAEYLAAEYQLNKGRRSMPNDLTVKEAIEKYISIKCNVLSPSTVVGYKAILNKYFDEIGNIKIEKLTSPLIQKEINQLSKAHSPKTVRNIYGLLTASLDIFYPDFTPKVSLPRKMKNESYIPTDRDIIKLLDMEKGTEMHIAILLASFLGLRRGEICGLKWDDVNLKEKKIKIKTSLVKSDLGEWVEKSPKSYAGNRTLAIPESILSNLKPPANSKGKPVIMLSPSTVTNSFVRLVKKAGLPHFRFHDLRHPYVKLKLKYFLIFSICDVRMSKISALNP